MGKTPTDLLNGPIPLEEQYRWENDTSLMDEIPGFAEAATTHTFSLWRLRSKTPDQAYPRPGFEEEKARYAEYLKQNPIAK